MNELSEAPTAKQIAYVSGGRANNFRVADIAAAMQTMNASMKGVSEAINSMEAAVPSTIDGLKDFKKNFLGSIPSQFKKQKRKFIKPVYTGPHAKALKSKRKAATKAKRRNR